MHTSSRRPSLSLTPAASSRRNAAAPQTDVDIEVLDSQSLLEGRPRIAIRHRDETYWLHETRQGKLLLTK